MSRPCTRNSNSGFTVIELLVTLLIILVVGSAALSMALSGRGIYEVDRARMRLNQNLRSGMDYLVTDIRQAGGQLGDDFPALILVNGTSGGPDLLRVRNNLEPIVLRVCQDISSGDTSVEVYIAQTGGTPDPGCGIMPDDDSDGWPDNLQAWRAFRNGQTVRAYIFNPTSGEGEFFDYVDEDNTTYYVEAGSITWQYDYPVSEQPRVYLLEEKRFELSNGMLKLTYNDDNSTAVNLIDSLQQFQLIAWFQDSSQQNTLDFSDVWSDLRAIEITLDGETQIEGGEPIHRTWTSEVMPRNVLSK